MTHPDAPAIAPLHILVLTRRDWPPPGAGVADDLAGDIEQWLAWGHRVTVIAPTRRGAASHERPVPGLEVRRMGGALTVIPRAALAIRRGALGDDVDVTLEEVSGATFLTPLWLHAPRVALQRGSNGDGGLAGRLLETLPLRVLYRETHVAGPEIAAGGAAATLEVLDAERTAERKALRSSLGESETLKATGLAAATMAANFVQLLFTVAFARILGEEGYGSLAALISTFLILSVPGLALQVATARETALGRLGTGGRLSAVHTGWMVELGIAIVAMAAAGILLREQLASAIGVSEEWAAAMALATGGAWLMLSIERGLLVGTREYKVAGLSVIFESFGRLFVGLILVAAGLSVTGAYLASPLSMLVTAAVLFVVLRRRLGPPEPHAQRRRLHTLIAGAWAPVIGLTLIAVLQNIDVIIVKHRVGGDAAGAYAAAAVAAKLVIWIGIGLAFYLVPEAARRAQAGDSPRPVLLRALAIILLVAAPMLAVYAVLPTLVLAVGFDVHDHDASRALALLGLAMTLLAVASLAVQYMLAIERYTFMWILFVVAATEPLLLASGSRGLIGVAAVVLALQAIAASGMLALSFRARARTARA